MFDDKKVIYAICWISVAAALIMVVATIALWIIPQPAAIYAGFLAMAPYVAGNVFIGRANKRAEDEVLTKYVFGM